MTLSIRTVEQYQLVVAPFIHRYRVYNMITGEVSMWFTHETIKNLLTLDNQEFISRAQELISHNH